MLRTDLDEKIQELHSKEIARGKIFSEEKKRLDTQFMLAYSASLESEQAAFSRTLGTYAKQNITEAYKIFRNGPGSHQFDKTGAENRSTSYIHKDLRATPLRGSGILICCKKDNVAVLANGQPAVYSSDAYTQEAYTRTTTLAPKQRTAEALPMFHVGDINKLHMMDRDSYSEIILKKVTPENVVGVFYDSEISLLSALLQREFFRFYNLELPIYDCSSKKLVRAEKIENLNFIGYLLEQLNGCENLDNNNEIKRARVELLEEILLAFMGSTKDKWFTGKTPRLVRGYEQIELVNVIENKNRDAYLEEMLSCIKIFFPEEIISALKTTQSIIQSVRTNQQNKKSRFHDYQKIEKSLLAHEENITFNDTNKKKEYIFRLNNANLLFSIVKHAKSKDFENRKPSKPPIRITKEGLELNNEDLHALADEIEQYFSRSL